jgi:hypothetical protein
MTEEDSRPTTITPAAGCQVAVGNHAIRGSKPVARPAT